MATEIIMPQLGESVVDGTVGAWLKQVGEVVAEYEAIVRVSTDKVDTEIPSPASGILLAIHVPEGSTVNAGVSLGVIGSAAEEPAAAPSVAVAAPSQGAAHVTPVVARMAAEHQLDLAQIAGTGRGGRITKQDVLAYLEQRAGASAAELPAWERPGSGDLFKPSVEYTVLPVDPPPVARNLAQQPPARAVALPAAVPGELLPLTPMRRAIAERMTHSVRTAPHVTTVFEVDLQRVVAHRTAHQPEYARQGVALTYTPYFVMACAAALRSHPLVNSTWREDGIFVYQPVHIGLATALEDGLIVPVIHHAGDYALLGLARQINDQTERARSKRLQPDEVRGGTFTITNHGISGSLVATPIINQPQTGILGIGLIEKRVKVIADMLAIRLCVYLSLTFDHRVLDGAAADAFLGAIKQQLEAWPD